jgi:hypothetical protein
MPAFLGQKLLIMVAQKLDFLTTGSFIAIKKLTPDAPPKWGAMNAQQMIEHLTHFYNVSIEGAPAKLYTPEEHLPKYMEFLMSEKEFRENTKAPLELLGDEPLPLKSGSLSEAIQKLKDTVAGFVKFFEEDRKTLHPVFGRLNYEEWIRLHYKHVVHHLKQFDLL